LFSETGATHLEALKVNHGSLPDRYV
jgi:hypothetical protein